MTLLVVVVLTLVASQALVWATVMACTVVAELSGAVH